jgi:hemolysin activation/secretion protein
LKTLNLQSIIIASIYFIPLQAADLQVNSMKKELVGVVKAPVAKVRNKAIPDDAYIVDNYQKGTIVRLEYCDEFHWCKIKDKQLFISEVILGVMEFLPKQMEQYKKKQQKCIELEQISLDKNDILIEDKQKELFRKYLSECIIDKTIENILKDITKFYMDQGYITTKPFLTPQNINDGQLDINISVGKIEKIIDTESNTTTSNILFAFVGQTNKPLNLRDIETSLESMNRVPSSKATFKIKPSNKRENSIVKVETKKNQLPFDFTIGASGKEDFEDKNPSLVSTLSIYNPLSINDILKFTINGSYIQKEYQSSKGNEINYSFSIGSYLIELIKSDSTYRQGVDGINSIYLSNGHTDGYKIKLSKIIYRDQKSKLKTALSLHHKDSKNYFEGNEIETSSYKTSHIQLDLSHTLIKSWGQLGTTFSIYQGKDWFGARGDDYIYGETDHTNDAKLEFTKYTLGINSTYNFYETYSLQSSFQYQYSSDNLYSSDKLSLGGDTSVRGYSGDYFGNVGWYLNNTITKNIDINLYEPLLQSISIYIGLDYGQTPCKDDNKESCSELYGSGLGIKSDSKNFSTNFSMTRPLKKLNDEFEIENHFQWSFTMKF